jgi:putative nucleotidyltransferase with HDIG domain
VTNTSTSAKLLLDSQAATGQFGSTIADIGYSAIVLDRLAEQAVQLIGVDRSCIFAYDEPRRDTAIVAAARGPDEHLVGERVLISAHDFPARGCLTVQLSWAGQVRGSLAVGSPSRPRLFTAAELSGLRALAEVAAGALDHAQTRAGRSGEAGAQIPRLCAALGERDRYTVGHSCEVTDMAATIGSSLALDQPALAELDALLHDIGKTRVPDSILNKPGPLTSEERAIISLHPDWGAEMISRVPGLEPVATIVRCHHERWDGGGYPSGLSGPQIPLASRIIAVCDSHNAMTSDRPYRPAMSERSALEEMRTGAGSQFDPGAVSQLEAVLGRQLAA